MPELYPTNRWLRMRAVALGEWTGWGLSLIMLVISIAFLANSLRLDEGHDLRNRIVGARALALGLNPYDLSSLGDGQVPVPALTDPFSWEIGFSATTAPPLVLQLYGLHSEGAWRDIHLFWMVPEYAGFLLAILLMAACAPSRRQAGWIAFLLTGLFGLSGVWLMHTWAGQYYSFVAFFIAGEAYLLRRPGTGKCLRGVLLGLAIPFRPFLIVIMPALWLWGARRAAVMACLLGLGMMGASVMARPALWASYSALTDRWVAFYANPDPDKFKGPQAGLARERAALDGYLHEYSAVKGPPPLRYGGFKTGINMAITGLRQQLFALNWKAVTLPLLVLIGGLTTLFALVRRRTPHHEASFALICCAPLLADLATPVASSYNFVMAIPAVAYVCLVAIRDRLWLLAPGLVPLFLVMRVPALELQMLVILILVGLVTFARRPLDRLQQAIGIRVSRRR